MYLISGSSNISESVMSNINSYIALEHLKPLLDMSWRFSPRLSPIDGVS